MGPDGAAARRGADGFSLLELLAVLLVVGMVAVIAVPRLSGTLESARLSAGASEVRATLVRARALAASGARERTVTFDPDRGVYGVGGDGRERALPEGIALARIGGSAPDAGPFQVRFFPDGSADATEISLASPGGGTARVVVDPMTGIVEARR